MVFIGITKGIKEYKFMRQANNTEFTATIALFDETMFPKCLKAKWRVCICIDENHAQDNPEKDKIQQIPSEDDNSLYPPSKNDKKKTRKIIVIMMKMTLIHQELIKSLLPLVNLLRIWIKGKSTKMCHHLQSIGNALVE